MTLAPGGMTTGRIDTRAGVRIEQEVRHNLLAFAGTLNPRSIPSTVVLDADGRVAASVQGRIPTTQTLLSLVETVLDE